MNDLFDAMREEVTGNMLRYQVGQQMFCPVCSAILDYRRAVSVDVMVKGKLHRTAVSCAPCWDTDLGPKIHAMATKLADQGVTVETVDGRNM